MRLHERPQNQDPGCAKFQRAKTHCVNGHEYTEENTVRWPSQPGSRRCLACQRRRGREKYKNYDPRVRKDFHLRAKYGITIDEFDAMLERQDGACAICGSEKLLRVDHDHETGEVRQILCHGCNAGLGHFQESPTALREAANYLEKHQ